HHPLASHGVPVDPLVTCVHGHTVTGRLAQRYADLRRCAAAGDDGAMTDITDRDVAEAQAADRLLTALRTRVACEPIREFIGATDLPAAYRVQERLSKGRIAGGARVVGRKIGLTSKAVQAQMGVDQPDFGVLFDDMAFTPDQLVPMG